MSCNGDEECDIRPGTVTPKKLPKQSGGGGHEFVTDLPETGDEGVEYVLMDDFSDCSTYRGTFVWNEDCGGWIQTSGSGGGAVERYTFEQTATGWRAKRNNTVIFTYVDKDTIDTYEDTADGFQIVRDGVIVYSYTDKGGDSKTYTIESTAEGWVFKEDGVTKFTYTEPANDPSDGTYFCSGVLSEAINGTTAVAQGSVTGLNPADIVIGETLIYDAAGTVGRVIAYNSGLISVQTITTAPGERRGTRLGAVDDNTDLPATVAAATAIGWQTPLAGDFAYVREDSDYDDHLTEYVIQNIDNSGNITWAYSHTLNAGNYVLDIYKYGDYPSGSPIAKNPDGSVTLPKDEDTKYDFEVTTDGTTTTGWRVKDHETGTVLFTYTDQDHDTDTTYDFEDVTISGTVVGFKVKDHDTGTVLYTYQAASTAESDGTYFTTETLETGITDTTTVPIANVTGLTASDIVIGETLIFDGDGTLGRVTAVSGTNLTVETVTTAGAGASDGSSKVFRTEETLDEAIDGLTTVAVADIEDTAGTTATIADIIVGKTIVNDDKGTVGLVTTISGTNLTIRTMTNSSDTTYSFSNTSAGWKATNNKTGQAYYHSDMTTLTDGEHLFNRGRAYFVDADNGDDSNDGSFEHPYKTLQMAVNQAAPYFYYLPEKVFWNAGNTTIYVNTSATAVYDPVYVNGKRLVFHSYDAANSTGDTYDTGLINDDKTATLKIAASSYERDDRPGTFIYPGCWHQQYSYVNMYIANLNFTMNAGNSATCFYIGMYSVFDHGYDIDQNKGMKYTITINANQTADHTEWVYSAYDNVASPVTSTNIGCEGIGVHNHSRFIMRGNVPSGSQLTIYSTNWGMACSDHSWIEVRGKATIYGGYNATTNCGAAYSSANSYVGFTSVGATTSVLGQLTFESIANTGTNTVITADYNSSFICQNSNQNLYVRKRATNNSQSNACFANHNSVMTLMAYNNLQIINNQVQGRCVVAGRGGTIRIGTSLTTGTYNILAANTGSPTTAGEAIEAYENGQIMVMGGTGTTLPNVKGRIGYAAWNGGKVCYAAIGKWTGVGTSPTQRSVSNGGRIYTGGQSSIGSY